MIRDLARLIVIQILTVVTAIFTVGAESPAKAPKIYMPQSSFHFGKVRQGEVVSHTFKIKNNGSADLDILRVVPGCGCTATNISTKKLKPQGESEIKVDFNTAGFVGKKVRNITIESNDPKMPVTILTLQGMIEPDVVVRPRAIDFGSVVEGDPAQREFTLVRAADSKATVSAVNTKSRYLNVKKVRDSGSESIYSVSLTNQPGPGTLRGAIAITVKGKDESSIVVPVFASIVPKSG